VHIPQSLILLARACNYLSRVGLAGHRQSW
jgi:hypothetical protein